MLEEKVLSAEVIKIAEDYFGPAANRVINRLTVNHLKKDPSELQPEDLTQLARWAGLAMSVVTEDETVINEFIRRLCGLAEMLA